MQWLVDLITNPYLLTGLSAWFFAQVAKTIIYAAIHKKIQWERMIGDGGMPSAHSATVTSFAVLCGLVCGLNSFQFAAAVLLAIIVCHDAMGVRLETGKQAVVLNEIVKAFEAFNTEELPEVQLKEFVGHTPIQVLAGILLGALDAVVMYFVLF